MTPPYVVAPAQDIRAPRAAVALPTARPTRPHTTLAATARAFFDWCCIVAFFLTGVFVLLATALS
ncbi:MAG: hypothetical protein JXR94_12920 [Candidatus Hydrogenedentes bacterium]|nr:hypothetical protein [Candidatus Hydrogenedentota bacterium]